MPSEWIPIAHFIIWQVVPFVGIPVALFLVFSRSAMGRAIIARARRDADELPPAVERELDSMRRELLEIHERLDFAERVLARPPLEDGRGARPDADGAATPPEPVTVP